MTSSFVTVAQYAAATQTTIVPASALEAAVQFALDAACDELRTFCSQDFDAVQGDVITLDGTNHAALLLPQLPVTAVHGVTIDLGLPTELVVTDWVLGFGGILYRKGLQVDPSWWWPHTPPKKWPFGFQNITVDYDHGFGAYEGIPFPNDLVNVAIQVARSVVSALPPGIKSETIGGYSYTRDSAAVVDVSAFSKSLEKYQAPRIPVG